MNSRNCRCHEFPDMSTGYVPQVVINDVLGITLRAIERSLNSATPGRKIVKSPAIYFNLVLARTQVLH